MVLARISEVFPSTDGLIRKVKLVKGDSELDDSGKRKGPVKELERPIHKLVLLLRVKTRTDSRPRSLEYCKVINIPHK